MKLHIGCGRTILDGWTNLDLEQLPGVDVVANLDTDTLPFDDDSVDEFIGLHVLEHLSNPLHAMGELYRVAKNGATGTFATPYGTSDDADEDPTHTRAMFPGSYGYFGQPFYWNKDYGYRGDWQMTDIELSVWESAAIVDGQRLDGDGIMRRIRHERNIVAEMVVQLEAIKPAREPLRELQQMPAITLRLAQG